MIKFCLFCVAKSCPGIFLYYFLICRSQHLCLLFFFLLLFIFILCIFFKFAVPKQNVKGIAFLKKRVLFFPSVAHEGSEGLCWDIAACSDQSAGPDCVLPGSRDQGHTPELLLRPEGSTELTLPG